MICAQLATCEECRNGTCKACRAYKRRVSAKRTRDAKRFTARSVSP